MGEFKMPSLGADMQKGTLVVWNVKPGDRVKRGDIIAVVETEKGAFDTECYEEGVIERLLVESGSKVPVGTVLDWANPAAGSKAIRSTRLVVTAPSGIFATANANARSGKSAMPVPIAITAKPNQIQLTSGLTVTV